MHWAALIIYILVNHLIAIKRTGPLSRDKLKWSTNSLPKRLNEMPHLTNKIISLLCKWKKCRNVFGKRTCKQPLRGEEIKLNENRSIQFYKELRGLDPLISLITLIWKFLGLQMTTVYIRMHWCQGPLSGCALPYFISKNIFSI